MNTLILEFNQTSSFNLRKIIHIEDLPTSGINKLNNSFQEQITLFNEAALDKPRILIPISNIDYILSSKLT